MAEGVHGALYCNVTDTRMYVSSTTSAAAVAVISLGTAEAAAHKSECNHCPRIIIICIIAARQTEQ